MFGNLLKEKWIIEEKVRKLQNKYITLRNQSVVKNCQSEEQKSCVDSILQQKQAILNQIKNQYTEIGKVYNDLEKLLADTKETALRTEELINDLAESLNINFPEEFLQQGPIDYSPIQNNREENQLNDNNIYNNVVENSDSDKENSKVETTPETSPDYFSPIIQIRKSVPLDNQLYTPAYKSQSKHKFRKFK